MRRVTLLFLFKEIVIDRFNEIPVVSLLLVLETDDALYTFEWHSVTLSCGKKLFSLKKKWRTHSYVYISLFHEEMKKL